MDSSRADVCSGEVPCLDGSSALCSCSTCILGKRNKLSSRQYVYL